MKKFISKALICAGFLLGIFFNQSLNAYAFPAVLGARVTGEEGVSIDGYQIEDPNQPVTTDTNKPVFSGYTIPNTEIDLTIKNASGDEVKANALSDANGFWTYIPDESLKTGQYTLYLQILDKEQSGEEYLAATFIVPEVKGDEVSTPPSDSPPLPKNPINYLTITITVLGSLLFLALLYAFFLRKQR